MRMTNEAFAVHLGLATRTVAKWHEMPDAEPIASTQEILDAALARASSAARSRFALLSSHVRPTAWELLDALTRAHIGTTVLDEMETLVTRYSVSYPTSPPKVLIAPVNRQLARLQEALTFPQRLSVQRRCIRLAGVLAGIAGNLYVDLNMPHEAAAMFRVGGHAATEISDADMAAWLLATESIAPYFSSRWDVAAELLDHAGSLAREASTRRRQSWISAMQARALAAAGDTVKAQRALAEAQSLIGQVVNPPAGNDFFDRPRLAGMAGSVLLLLRDTSAASTLLMEAMKSRAVQDVKGRALLTLDLASCRVIDSEPVEAARLAAEALSVAQDTLVAPVVNRLRQVNAELRPWASLKPIVELRAQLAEATRRELET
jgi:hypothetical protein